MLIVMAAMMSASCVEEVDMPKDDQSSEKVQMTFSAVSDVETKLTLVDNTQIWWEPGDGIFVNGDLFNSTLQQPSLCSDFVGRTVPSDEYHAVSTDSFIEWDGKDYVFSLSSQMAVKDDLPVYLSAAKSTGDLSLHFKNLLGYVKFTIPEGLCKISSVEVYAKGDEAMSGWPAVVDFSGDTPFLSLKEPGPDEYPNPYLVLSFDAMMKPGDYYMAMYPGTYSNGLRFIFCSEDGKVAIKEINQEVTLEAGAIKNIGTVSDTWWKEFENQFVIERDALIAFYNATGGDNWTDNTNWCSDRPLDEWYGIMTDQYGMVSHIHLDYNNLTGTLPDCIGDFKYLSVLSLEGNQLTGKLPASIGNLRNLLNLRVGANALSGSIPESIGNLKQLLELHISINQLTGKLPASICNLTNLKTLEAYGNSITGGIPESIGNMANLEFLWLEGNRLTGELPSSIGNLTRLREMLISDNSLSGQLPESMGNLTNLEICLLSGNYFTGIVPKGIMEMDFWPTGWHDVLAQRGEGFSSEGLIIPAPRFSEMTIDGDTIDDSVYSENEYTILYHYNDWCHFANDFTPTLVELYKGYNKKGLEVIAYSCDGTIESHRKFAETHNTEWPYLMLSEDFYNSRYWVSPGICVIDKDGYIIFNYCTDDYNDLDDFLLEKLGEPDPTGPSDTPKLYESTDYSKDGDVIQLQAATKGNGIDIVLMGDAYSDRLIADGTYERIMHIAMEKIFEEEPYKSFRDHFNVYSVTAVSKNEVYSQYSETAFDCYFGDMTVVGGDNPTAFSYAAKAIGEDRIEDALIIVMMNSVEHAGTCYMYVPTSGDWGNGASVSYFPVGSDEETLKRLIQHEAAGHGFSKLSDEYSYYEYGHIPEEEIQYYREMEEYGWGKNVDFTSDPAEVKWSHFLTDSRYANEGLGVFEGACTFWTGAYRPTDNSIMKNNWGGFNAPSREAIYYRIHKLAYGPDWEYDYEKFVEYDAVNRKSASEAAAPQKRRANYVEKPFEPTAPPVIIRSSWRDAVTE